MVRLNHTSGDSCQQPSRNRCPPVIESPNLRMQRLLKEGASGIDEYVPCPIGRQAREPIEGLSTRKLFESYISTEDRCTFRTIGFELNRRHRAGERLSDCHSPEDLNFLRRLSDKELTDLFWMASDVFTISISGRVLEERGYDIDATLLSILHPPERGEPGWASQWFKNQEIIPEGGRNDSLFRLGSFLKGVREFKAHSIEMLLQDINRKYCRPRLGRREVTAIGKSAAKQGVRQW